MSKFWRGVKNVFAPPPGSSAVRRILPYAIIIIIGTALLLATTSAWQYTNTSVFCGTACHTMTPQYVTHINSSHVRVTCEECHLGRTELGEQIVRKIEYSWQTGSAMVTGNYVYPIRAENMRPSVDVCETCHYPEQFVHDTLTELKRFDYDKENTLNYTYLILKTGGGTSREGLGYGIHWHIENPVDFIALDDEKQDIPYVRVQNPDGSFTEYIDTESGFDTSTLDESQLVRMDCMSCHNRTSHISEQPDEAVDSMLARGIISSAIPEIKMRAVEYLSKPYASVDEAERGIAELGDFYRKNYNVYYQANSQKVDKAVTELIETFKESNFPEHEFNWNTHPDNAQHKFSPGCLRCHDGKHLTVTGEAVRLECNLCHSIPVVSASDEFITDIEISRGPEPESHLSSNWISLHREYFDSTCVSCHTVEDPGGTSNTSFCSNSGCHGTDWEYAGFDAPGLRVVLADELRKFITPTAAPTEPIGTPPAENSFASIQSLLGKCTACHGENGQLGLDLTSYESLMSGGENGPVVVPFQPQQSLLVTTQQEATPHFGQFTETELQQIITWIEAGAQK
ncbi:MAG: NapC/NirT family cytochrome c [Bellilinea sp.]